MLSHLARKSAMHAALALFIACISAGCAASSSYPLMNVDIIDTKKLPSTIKESSGLFCTSEGTVTMNDSGNDAILYFLNKDGKIQKKQKMTFANKDIEALTADASFYYIGDIGNNRGNRTFVSVRQVDKASFKKVQTYRLTYKGNTPSDNIPYNHDYDAEALTVHNEKLVLFSKSWRSENARVYEIAASPKSQRLSAVKVIKGLPGIITGADWDDTNQRFIVVGYNSNLLGVLRPFIATLSVDYTVLGVAPLARFGQVEGVCAQDNGEIWLTQEKSPLQDARLIRLKLQ